MSRANFREVFTRSHVILVSYSTPVAYRDRETGKVFRTDTRYSVTTSRHINQWLKGRKAEEVPQSQIDALMPVTGQSTVNF